MLGDDGDGGSFSIEQRHASPIPDLAFMTDCPFESG
jgi:hypothetical protein